MAEVALQVQILVMPGFSLPFQQITYLPGYPIVISIIWLCCDLIPYYSVYTIPFASLLCFNDHWFSTSPVISRCYPCSTGCWTSAPSSIFFMIGVLVFFYLQIIKLFSSLVCTSVNFVCGENISLTNLRSFLQINSSYRSNWSTAFLLNNLYIPGTVISDILYLIENLVCCA